MQATIRNLETFATYFKRLERKATKLKIPVPSWKLLGERLDTVRIWAIEESGRKHVGDEQVIVYDIEIENIERLKINGWQFVARVEATEAGSIFYALPGVEIPEDMRSLGCACQHCNADRRRTRLYIVQNAPGLSR